MSESPAQQAARLRRERREARIKDGGAARLDRITNLSGRANHDPNTPQPTSLMAAPQPVSTTSTTTTPASTTPTVHDESPEDLQDFQSQEENFRALLRQVAPAQGQQQQQGPPGLGPQEEEDPAVKLLHSLIGGNLPESGTSGSGSGGGDNGGGSGSGGATQADLLSALGVPPILADMAGAATRTPTAEEKKEAALWKTVHVVFAVMMGVYVLGLIGRGIATYGNPPPPPATARNPFLIFTTGELVLSSVRMALQRGPSGLLGRVSQCMGVVGDIVRDGSLMVFVLGIGNLLQ